MFLHIHLSKSEKKIIQIHYIIKVYSRTLYAPNIKQ